LARRQLGQGAQDLALGDVLDGILTAGLSLEHRQHVAAGHVVLEAAQPPGLALSHASEPTDGALPRGVEDDG
jgi:hypothetical protein